MISVGVQQRTAELNDCADALVRQAVVDGAVLAACGHEAAPAQAGEMVRDLRLRLAELLGELSDRALSLGHELEDAQPGAVPEHAEVLRQQVGLDGRDGQPERRISKRSLHASIVQKFLM